MQAIEMTWHTIYEVREETSFMGMKPCIHCFQDSLYLACSLGNTKDKTMHCVSYFIHELNALLLMWHSRKQNMKLCIESGLRNFVLFCELCCPGCYKVTFFSPPNVTLLAILQSLLVVGSERWVCNRDEQALSSLQLSCMFKKKMSKLYPKKQSAN